MVSSFVKALSLSKNEFRVASYICIKARSH